MPSLHSRWEARIVIPTGGWTAVLAESGGGGTPVITFAAAKTYYHSSAGNDSVSFAARLKALLDAASPNARTYTVTISAGELGTGFMTISVSAGTFSLTSVNADLRALMGFAGDLTPTAASFVGTLHAEAIWLPDCPTNTPYHLGSAGMPQAQAAVSVAPDGTYNNFTGAKHVRNEISYEAVAQRKAITAAETTTGASYQSFWLDAIYGEEPWAAIPGGQLRWYKDVSDNATFKTFNVLQVTSPDMTRMDASWDGLWRVRLEVVEHV